MAYRRRKSRGISPAGIALLILMAIIISCCVYIVKTLASLGNDPQPEVSSTVEVSEETASPIVDRENDSSITNIALFGVDQREDEPCRSDAIMIVSVDKRHNKIKMTSIMRDSYVPIAGKGKGKINSAYFYGGPELAVQTLNDVFDLDIEDYATVNFAEMAEIIDAVGGVSIDISEAERVDANHNMIEQSTQSGKPVDTIEHAGPQTLSGMQAVAYARIRHVGNSDYDRTLRQRRVMEQIFERGKAMNPLEYPVLIYRLLPIVETSLGITEIFDLAGLMLRDVSFEGLRIPCNSDLINGGSLLVNGVDYLYYDLESSEQKIHDFIYQDRLPQ